jgi:L-rhamnose mutarotase
MGEDFAANCYNWGNPVCHPDVRKYLDFEHKESDDFSMLPDNNEIKKFNEICKKCDFLDLENNRDHSKVEDQYNPVYVISNVWGKFRALLEHQNSQVEDYSIFIETKQSENEGYLIKYGNDAFLWRGTISGTRWRVIQEPEELYENRNFLGKVHIKFKGKKIKMGNESLGPFPSYNMFWNYIKK